MHKTLPFHELFTTLFNPLNEQRKKPGTAAIARKKLGPHGKSTLTPQEAKRNIIERFISRWRNQVGNDIYPALRLIVPEKDRDRAMYGLKEKTIGKILVKIIGIDKNSEDAYNLINWKLPGFRATASAGDFAARCYEVLQKRPILTKLGTMSIAEVNEKLDRLSAASKESEQVPLFEDFYRRMNPEELMWLVRMILRQMKIGATEKTFFDIWHPDAEALFNVSSSLRRVCWELYDPTIRLDSDASSVTLMQCFQPQLANFQNRTFEKMVASMAPTEEDDEFWVEEKLDGERMQLHMATDASVLGGKRFAFWSRKGKEYTYLYGSGFEDDSSSLTRHLKEAFDEGVQNIILDGEMITWNMQEDSIVAFGHLKTAALSESRNPYQEAGIRPLFKVFDCLYLNDQPITGYTMRDRRKALEASVKPVHRRLEIHEYETAHNASEIEPKLRKVVEQSSEGLVLKNPRSAYKLSERNDDWWKVKPEYMTEFGEALDCVVVGGYYGSGHRGGMLSSFLCGLLVDEPLRRKNGIPNEEHTWSFFKVGGGMSASDYAEIRQATEGKWKVFDPKKPPSEYITLAGGDRMYERPDMWIKPSDSVVVEVKAAQVSTTEQFFVRATLRFPRFKRLRSDKSWRDALSIMQWHQLKEDAEQSREEKKMEVDDERKKRRAAAAGPSARRKKKPLTVHGADTSGTVNPYAGPDTSLFQGISFFILCGADKPFKKSKQELEQLIKSNGGAVVQSQSAAENVICVADKNVVKVSSIRKAGVQSIVRPKWLFDCIEQQASQLEEGGGRFLLPMEPGHMLFTAEGDKEVVEGNVDEFGDSYARDVGVEELMGIFEKMEVPVRGKGTDMLHRLEERDVDLGESRGLMFRHVVAYLDLAPAKTPKDGDIDMTDGDDAPPDPSALDQPLDMLFAKQKVVFGSGRVADSLADEAVTHIIVGADRSRLAELRKSIAAKPRLPRLVTVDWVMRSWEEETLLDEERFVP